MRILKRIVVGLSLLLIIAFALLHLLNFNPPKIKKLKVFGATDAPTLSVGQQVHIMSWNVQFMAGNKNNHFFFSGGNDSWPTKKTVLSTLGRAAAVIQAEDPDIVLLQEVDDHSIRTHFVDQVRMLRKKLPQYKVFVRAYYWKSWFVPHPAMLGPGITQLLILSKYKIEESTRYALPSKLKTYYLRHFFEAKRAILEAVLPVQNAQPLHVYGTHFSAFAQGNDTMQRQVALAQSLLTANEQANEPGILGGDINLLASATLRARVSSTDQKYYAPNETELKPLLKLFKSYPTFAEVTGANYKDWYTQMPTALPNKILDKTIDFFFVTKQVKVLDHQVVTVNTKTISDHLPITIRIKL